MTEKTETPIAAGVRRLKGDALVKFLAEYDYDPPPTPPPGPRPADVSSDEFADWYQAVNEWTPGDVNTWGEVEALRTTKKIDLDTYYAALDARTAKKTSTMSDKPPASSEG